MDRGVMDPFAPPRRASERTSLALELAYDEGRFLPVEPRPAGAADAWARDVVARHVAAHPEAEPLRERLAMFAAGLAAEPAGADGSAEWRFVLADPVGGIVAPFLLFATTRTDDPARRDLVWDRAAFLGPVARTHPTEHLGTGVTTLFVVQDHGHVLATRRWLYPGVGASLCAVLGPLPPGELIAVQEIVQAVLAGARAEGFAPDDDGWAEAFVGEAVPFGDAWEYPGGDFSPSTVVRGAG